MSTRPVWVLAILLLSCATAAAQVRSEVFNFPQNHDTAFGDNLFLGDFFWFADGDGARGRRISTNGIASVEAVGFNLFLGPSCVGPNAAVSLEVYVNDRLVGVTPMPDFVNCTTAPAGPVSATFDISANPIAGIGADRTEYELRIQLRGNLPPVPGLFTFFAIDTSNSTIAVAGFPDSEPPDDPPPPDEPPPPPPPPPDPHPTILDQINQSEGRLSGRIDQSEETINSNVAAQGDRAVSAIAAVQDALGIVENNVQASIAGAVLGINSTVAAGIDTLAQRLGVPTQQLANAIDGNKDALDTIQKTIVDSVVAPLRAKIEADEIRIIANNLSSGVRNHDSFRPESLLKVVPIVGDAIQLFESLGIRPASVVNKAKAEFNRGLRRLKKLFITVPVGEHSVAMAYFESSLSGPDGAAVFGISADKPEDEEDLFGAYVLMERAYQTLVTGQEGLGPK